MLEKIREHSVYKKECENCEYLDRCWRCRSRVYAVTGDYRNADPICPMEALDIEDYDIIIPKPDNSNCEEETTEVSYGIWLEFRGK